MRPETGPMRFGPDWAGTFIRGDDSMFFAKMIEEVTVLLSEDHAMMKQYLDELASLLRSCFEPVAEEVCQHLKKFEECERNGAKTRT